ncbi:MAG: glycosyltransferase family 4 protein [Terriglobales bacterium]
MRILYFSRWSTSHDRRFLEKLATSQHNIFFAQLQPGTSPLQQYAPPPGVTPVEWKGLPAGLGAVSAEALVEALPAFEQMLAEVAPHLVHAGPILDCGFLAALSGHHPNILMSWGSDLLVDAESSPARRWLASFALRRADFFVCDCETVKAQAEKLIHRPMGETLAFPWGVDLERFMPAARSSGMRERLGWEQNIVLIATRAWEPAYDVDILIKAFAEAVRHESRLRLILLGGGSMETEFKSLIGELGVEAFVHSPGFVPETELPALFQAADLYVSAVPSDGSSISLLQAFATGLPAVVADAAGNREWVTKDCGWLAGVKDPQAFAAAIAELCALPRARVDAMRRHVHEVALARGDWNRNSAQLLALYDRVAAQGPTRAHLNRTQDVKR